MSNFELPAGTGVVAKFSDGNFYRGNVVKRLRTGRYRVGYDDDYVSSVEWRNIFVASSDLAAITRKLENCQSKLRDVRLARDAARQTLLDAQADLV
jgi:hypothetical protein